MKWFVWLTSCTRNGLAIIHNLPGGQSDLASISRDAVEHPRFVGIRHHFDPTGKWLPEETCQ